MKYLTLLLCCLVASTAAFNLNLQLDASALQCSICEYIVSEMVDLLEKNTSSADILYSMNQDCAELYNPSWISTCQQIVSEDGAELLPYLQNNDPSGACAHYEFCAESSVQQKTPIKGEIECGVCTLVASKVEDYVAENKTESEITTQLNKDCRVFHDKSWVSVCAGLVDEFTPEMIQLAEAKYPADVVCQDIKFCNASSAPQVVTATASIECSVCEWIVAIGEKYVEENKTETEILAELTKSCSLLIDNTWKTDCSSLIETTGPAIVQYLLQKETSSVICSQVGACSKKALVIVAPVVGDDIECSVCTWLTTLGERWVEENKTETKIIEDLAKSCDALIDEKFVEECKTELIENGDLIVEYLLNKEDPQVICQQIDACNSSSSLPLVSISNVGDVECSVCEWVATLAEHYIEQNKTETDIIDSLAIACDVLIDDTWVSDCHDLVEEDGDLLIQYLLNEETPEQVCSDFEACPSN